MSFFDVFMLVLGVVDVLTLIFCAVCKLIPRVLEYETVDSIYNFIIGNDVYETE